jgi:hypothetical protein
MEDTREAEYIPGSCNLGKEEIRHRMRIGYIGVALTFLVFLVLEILDSPRLYRIFILPPIFYALSGFIQARHRFCYLYGWVGLFSLTGRKQFHRVGDKENARKDRMTALKIVIMVLFGSVMLTGLYMVI